MSHGNMFLFTNGVVSPAGEVPLVTTFLEEHSGAYTTTRTHNNGSSILFWERHLQRLTKSFKVLLKANPKLLFEKHENREASLFKSSDGRMMQDSAIHHLVNRSMSKVMPFVLQEIKQGEEFAITALLSGNLENIGCLKVEIDERTISEVFNVYLHISKYVPAMFGVQMNAACLALVGRGRDFANAKYSDWVRVRKSLEKVRSPGITELLLSNDGEHILEGCLTNFFVVCQKEKSEECNVTERNEMPRFSDIEVQSAPVNDGVLPGVIRHVIRDICLEIGIPFREVAPSWSHREHWNEAFITSSLRLLQHVKTIQAPYTWEFAELKTWEEITWVEKRFEDFPGRITSIIQREILKKADLEAFPLVSFEYQCPQF